MRINTANGAFSTALDNGLFFWGDSLTESTSGGILPHQTYPVQVAKLFSPQRTAYNGGVGGETSTQIAARQTIYPCGNAINIFWAGRNDVATSGDVLTPVASMVATMSDERFVVLSILNKTDGTENTGSAARTYITTTNASLLAAYPDNYLDVTTALDNNSYRGDGLHLNLAGIAIVADAVYDFITAKGW